MNNKMNKKGFSLMEIVMSIGVLAFTSGFIIQMFLVASSLNQKAIDLDTGSNIAMNHIEMFKSSDTPSRYLMENFYDTEKETSEEDNKEFVVHKYYDSDWEEIPVKDNAKFVLGVRIKMSSKKNESTVSFDKDKGVTKTYDGNIYYVEASIDEKLEDNKNKVLVSFDSSKYFVR